MLNICRKLHGDAGRELSVVILAKPRVRTSEQPVQNLRESLYYSALLFPRSVLTRLKIFNSTSMSSSVAISEGPLYINKALTYTKVAASPMVVEECSFRFLRRTSFAPRSPPSTSEVSQRGKENKPKRSVPITSGDERSWRIHCMRRSLMNR